MNNNAGCLIMFLIIVGFTILCQMIYASSQGAPQCIFSSDMITCIEIVRANK